MQVYNIYRHAGEGPNSDRYVLGRQAEGRNLLAVCLNPSTATDRQSDPTMTRLKGFAERNGFDGFVMVNLYPQRSTDPALLDATLDPNRHRRNIEEIGRLVCELSCDTVLVAWGAAIELRPYLTESCLTDLVAALSAAPIAWKCIGLTKRGHPRHPSRAAYGELLPFDPTDYLRR